MRIFAFNWDNSPLSTSPIPPSTLPQPSPTSAPAPSCAQRWQQDDWGWLEWWAWIALGGALGGDISGRAWITSEGGGGYPTRRKKHKLRTKEKAWKKHGRLKLQTVGTKSTYEVLIGRHGGKPCLRICITSCKGANKITKNQEIIIRHCLKKMFLRVLMRICISVYFLKKSQPEKVSFSLQLPLYYTRCTWWAGGTFIHCLRKVPCTHSRCACVLQELGWKYT